MNDQALPGPGWYPDPNDSATNRYWDGHRWTESRAPIARQKAEFEGADAVGYVLAILLPLIGFIIGLVRLNKSKHGIWIVVTSVVIFILWLALISSAGTANAQTGGVTLEPGTKLTVVCEGKKLFRGAPFVPLGDAGEAPFSTRRRQNVRTRRFHLGHYTAEPAHTYDNLVIDAVVTASRQGGHRFRLRVFGQYGVAWRGC